jgi:hypothetical protein
MTFQMTIEIGNDAMQDGEDIARAIRSVAARVAMVPTIDDDVEAEGIIRDDNGNKVGEWSVSA